MAEVSTLNGYKIKDKKAIRYYDTVADMIADTTLKSGMHCKTKGYYLINDGGASEYHITSVESETEYQEALNNNLYANLIVKDYIIPEMFGAKGDGVTDDTLSIQNAIDKANYYKAPIHFFNKTYLISNIKITHRQSIVYGNNATLKSIDNNNNDNLFELYNDGAIYTIIYDLNLDGNKENNVNTINGLYVYRSTFADVQSKINNVHIYNFTGYGIYVTGGHSYSTIREIKFDKVISRGNKIGLYANSMTDSYILNSTFADNTEYGIYLDVTGSIKITNTKSYFNGKGINTDIDQSRIPEGGSSDDYKNHGNGIYLNNCTGTSITACEIQDNAGDGIYCNGGTLFNFSNISCDCNGLIWDDSFNILTYASQGINQYFYGIYFNNSLYINVTGYFNNYRYNESGIIQKSSIYLKGENSNISIISRLQSTPIEYENINVKKTNIFINGESLKLPLALTNVTLDTGYTLTNNDWNSSYIYAKNNTIYFKLCIKNDSYIPTTQTTIGTVNSLFRPLMNYIQNAITSTAYEDMPDGTGSVVIDKNGNIKVKSDLANAKIINIQGSYLI